MEIKTLNNIGDIIYVDGKKYRILGLHIYVSNNIQTERYYLENRKWITIKRGR